MDNFLKVLTEDAEVREEFLRQKTPEGAYNVAKPYLDEMAKEEFVESLLGIARVMDGVQSDADLTTVSGGVQGYEAELNFKKAMETFIEHF